MSIKNACRDIYVSLRSNSCSPNIIKYIGDLFTVSMFASLSAMEEYLMVFSLDALRVKRDKITSLTDLF